MSLLRSIFHIKISINYCAIKNQIVIILSKKKVRSVSILQFSEDFQLNFDNSNVNNDKQIKQKMANRVVNFFLLILLREATLKSKVAPANRKSSAFLLHFSMTFSNVELFSISSHTFRHQNKNNVVETISCFVYQLSKKYCVNYVSEHLKYC